MTQIHSEQWDETRAYNNPDSPSDAIQLISDARCKHENPQKHSIHTYLLVLVLGKDNYELIRKLDRI